MQMVVDGDNSFHTGWLARMLGLPRFWPGEAALKPEAVSAFNEGWDTCNETPVADRLAAFEAMCERGQAFADWIDDDGEDVFPT